MINVEEAFKVIAMAARDVGTQHAGMLSAFAEEQVARVGLFAALYDAVRPALPALANRVSAGGDDLWIVTLVRGRKCFHLGARERDGAWALWESDPDGQRYVPLEVTGTGAVLPREFDLVEVVSNLGELLRSVEQGSQVRRRSEARALARRMESIQRLLED